MEKEYLSVQKYLEQTVLTDHRIPEPINQLYKGEYQDIVKYLKEGTLVPVLGRNINLCGRQNNEAKELKNWQPENGGYPPSGRELAAYLARSCPIPSYFGREEVCCPLLDINTSDSADEQIAIPELFVKKAILTCPYSNQRLAVGIDLSYWSQCVALNSGSGELNDMLRSLFHREYTPNPVHEFFAELPTKLKNQCSSHPYQLIVTTNYDDVLENAFERENQPYDIVSYIATGDYCGKFRHRSSEDGRGEVIEKPGEYRYCSLKRQSVILKIHGAVDWTDSETKPDGFVITEDQYIDYLARASVSNILPTQLLTKLMNSHILFLGYDLSDWYMRAILHFIWKDKKIGENRKSWAIPFDAGKLASDLWQKRDVEMLKVPLESFIAELRNLL